MADFARSSSQKSEDAVAAPRFAMQTHRGRVRRSNQDACAAALEDGAFVVCDGIGGAAGGEIASRLAADAFLESLRRVNRVESEPAMLLESSAPEHKRMHAAVTAANEAVFRHSRRAPHLSGMGTTLVAALCAPGSGGTLWLANVGDSRCYRLRAGSLELLTEDHSLVQEQVRAGTLSSLEAAASPIRNIITRAVGSLIYVEADIAAHELEVGDVYLLASDGLTRELEDDEVAAILLRELRGDGDALEHACNELVEQANANGGNDNITVLLIAF